MIGKTHMAVGVSTALLIMQPTTIKELVIGFGTALVGSVISDIDISMSISRKKLNKVTKISIIVVIVSVIFNYLLELELGKKILANSTVSSILLGFGLFMLICTYGKNTPHRTFTHSILGVLLFAMSVNILAPIGLEYFIIGIISHIILDMLNYKKLCLLYPSHKCDVSLKICKADSKVGDIIFCVGIILLSVDILMFVIRFFS